MDDVRQEQALALQVAVTDLGPVNLGDLGPHDVDTETKERLINDLGAPEYSRKASRRWICVDGRLCPEEEADTYAESDTADPQTGGGIVVTEIATSYMDDIVPAEPQSDLATELTASAIADDIEVTIHGDEGKGAGGCKAKTGLREVLKFNAAYADIVGPKTWEVSQAMGLSDWITPEDVTRSILTGNERAKQDALWDVTPEQFDEIVLAQPGAENIVLKGSHGEFSVRASLVEGEAFAKGRYVKDHSTSDLEIEAFSASFGEYKAVTFERAQKHGRSERDAALQVMRAILFNVGLTKLLQNDKMPTALVMPAAQ